MRLPRSLRAALVGLIAIAAPLGVVTGSAQAIVLAQNGHWCGIDTPQPLSYYKESSFPSEYPASYRGSCQYASTHFLGYKVSAHAIRFTIENRKFLKEMYVGDEKWIGSADIGSNPSFRASENGHDVSGRFVRDFFATGTISLQGQSDYFYAFWVSS